MKVAIIGASSKPDRYANRAQRMLAEHGHEPVPISASGEEILGQTSYQSILDVPSEALPIHTATIYLNPHRFAEIADDVLARQPDRVIFNPGTESPEIAEKFQEAGIHVIEACTLVLLSTGQFEEA